MESYIPSIYPQQNPQNTMPGQYPANYFSDQNYNPQMGLLGGSGTLSTFSGGQPNNSVYQELINRGYTPEQAAPYASIQQQYQANGGTGPTSFEQQIAQPFTLGGHASTVSEPVITSNGTTAAAATTNGKNSGLLGGRTAAAGQARQKDQRHHDGRPSAPGDHRHH